MKHSSHSHHSFTFGEEQLATAIHAVRLSQPRPADSAAVIGNGPLALATVAVLLARGVCKVALLTDSGAAGMRDVGSGAQVFPRPNSSQELERIRSSLGGYGPDLVFGCESGSESHRLAIELARPAGMIVLMDADVTPTTINPNLLVLTDKRLLGSRNFDDADLQIARDLIQTRRLRLDNN